MTKNQMIWKLSYPVFFIGLTLSVLLATLGDAAVESSGLRRSWNILKIKWISNEWEGFNLKLKFLHVRSWSRNCPHCMTMVVNWLVVMLRWRWTRALTVRAVGRAPPWTDRRKASTPSPYSAGRKRWNGRKEAPHSGCSALLHVPSPVRYRALKGGHTMVSALSGHSA